MSDNNIEPPEMELEDRIDNALSIVAKAKNTILQRQENAVSANHQPLSLNLGSEEVSYLFTELSKLTLEVLTNIENALRSNHVDVTLKGAIATSLLNKKGINSYTKNPSEPSDFYNTDIYLSKSINIITKILNITLQSYTDKSLEEKLKISKSQLGDLVIGSYLLCFKDPSQNYRSIVESKLKEHYVPDSQIEQHLSEILESCSQYFQILTEYAQQNFGEAIDDVFGNIFHFLNTSITLLLILDDTSDIPDFDL